MASLRPDGWRPTAWVAGLLPALLGVASLIYPVSSSLETPWAIAAIAWGIGFVVVAERSRSREDVALVASNVGSQRSPTDS
jgi:hypothetical protein